MNQILALIKSGQAKQYFQQNITFLGLPEGAVVTTRYKRRWVCHGEDDELPENIVIFYSEPPFAHVLPVRTALLRGYSWDEPDGDFEYVLELGPLLNLPEFDQVDQYIASVRPGDNVVFSASVFPHSAVEGSAQSRWNALVYHLTSDRYAGENNPYRHALFNFVYPDPLPGVPVVGQMCNRVVSLLAPGLNPEALRDVRVHSEAPVLDAAVDIEGTVAGGQLRVGVQPLRPLDHEWQVTLFFRPNDVASGQVILQFPAIKPSELPETAQAAFDRRQLFEWLSSRLSPTDQLRLLDRYLIPAGNGKAPDCHLLFERAALLQQEGRPQEAVETLLQIPAEQRHDETIVLLMEAAIATQRRLPFKKLVEEVSNWEDGRLAGRLVLTIARLQDDAEKLDLASHLCRLAPNYAQRVWQTVGVTLRSPALRLQLVEMLEKGHANQSNGYLRLGPDEIFSFLARDGDARRCPDAVLDRLVATGMESKQSAAVAPYLIEWLERTRTRADAANVTLARRRFEAARGWLSTQQFERALTLLNDALKRVGETETAMWLVLGRVTDAQRTGDLDMAERWLKVARDGISALPPDKRSTMLELVKEEDGNIKANRAAISSSFAPRFGNDPGLAALFELYQVEGTPAFWADVVDLMRANPFVVQQLVERLEQLSKFGQESGTTNARIHSLSDLQGNVHRLELSDQSRVIFKRIGKRVRLIALYATHDAYDEAIKNRYELLNRIRQ